MVKCTDESILKICKGLKTTKSSGIENVRTIVIKDTLTALPELLCQIVNTTIETASFPPSWKVGTIVPLPKGGILTSVGNWRPVCLLNVCAKVCEKILHRQLLDHMLQHGHMADTQYGFIPGRSTSDAVLGLSNDLYAALNHGLPSAVVFIDLRKAFDTVNHIILLQKLSWYGVKDHELRWFENYLYLRSQCTLANGLKSEVEGVPCGVPQGSVLGPLLFLIYINDVQSVIKHTRAYMYADDLAVVASNRDILHSRRLLQEDITAIGGWCNANKLTINTDKTYVLWTYPKNSPPDLTRVDIELNGKTLSVVPKFNYLGIIIDRYLSLVPQCLKVINLVKIRLAQLRSIKRRSDKPTALLVYKSMILPIMEYSSILIGSGPVWATKKLETLQNDCLRVCEGIRDPRDIHVEQLRTQNGVELLEERRHRQLLGLMYKMSLDPDNVIVPVRELRGGAKIKLKRSRPHKDIYYKSPLYRGTQLWDRLDGVKQHSTNRENFLKSLTKHDLRPIEPRQ